MRIARLLVAVGLLTAGTATAHAQTNPECAPYDDTDQGRNICNAAVDGTRAFLPVAGILLSGGNAVLGSGGTLGGLGHFAISVRANAAELVLPDLGYEGEAGAVPADQTIVAPAPLLEGALGLYEGMPGGLLAIDLLASANLLPTDQIDNVRVDDDAPAVAGLALGLGYGARVGIMDGVGPLPAISVSLMRRSIPQFQYGDVSAGDEYSYAVDLHATNLRAAASKQLGPLGVAAGLGWDWYGGEARVEFEDPDPLSAGVEVVEMDLDASRGVLFLNAGITASIVRLVGEIGYQTARDQDLTTEFEDFDTTAGRIFGGVGLTVGW